MADVATGAVRYGTTQTVAVTSTSATHSTAFGQGTRIVRLVPTVSMHLVVSNSGTAATTSHPRFYGGLEYFTVVNPGEKIAAIRTTTSGTLYVTECS